MLATTAVALKLCCYNLHVDGLMQERCTSIANALELCLSCINPSMYCHLIHHLVFFTATYHMHDVCFNV